MDKKESKITPNYKRIYNDILNEMFPEKKHKFNDILSKPNLSSLDIINLNSKIFEKEYKPERKYHSYNKSDILEMLDYQKKYKLNDSQLAKHFKISRNSVAKWKKIFL